MKTPIEAIHIGIKDYLEVYKQAVHELWQHDVIIDGIPVENWLIAQATQESRFNANAISPVGALGIAQFMPATTKDVSRALQRLKLTPKASYTYYDIFEKEFDATNPIQSIYAQVYYMNTLFKMWHWKRSNTSKMQLTLASYNAGTGNILKAQKASGDKRHWIEIKSYLKRITAHHSKETIKYVSNIGNFALIIEDYKV